MPAFESITTANIEERLQSDGFFDTKKWLINESQQRASQLSIEEYEDYVDQLDASFFSLECDHMVTEEWSQKIIEIVENLR